jgi:hypothetical protein
MNRSIFSYALFLFLSACNIAALQSILDDSQLTEGEVIDGLKTALRIGTDKAISITSATDGYFKDQAIKILLPDEANKAITALREAPGGEQLYKTTISPIIDDFIVAINRSAEDAATEAAPIFKNAITQMTVQEAWEILRGEYKNAGDKAATTYFKDKTYNDLVRLFQPKIDQSLDKPLVSNVSANRIWNNFVKSYDAIAKSPANLVMKLKPVKEPNLARYVTTKALDGLFVKVSDEEQKIRENPYQYASRIIEKVFGNRTGS